METLSDKEIKQKAELPQGGNNRYQIVFDMDYEDETLKTIPKYISKQVADITGFKPEDFYSKKVVFNDQVHKDDIQAIINSKKKLIAKNQPVNRMYRFLCKNGEYAWFEDTLVPKADGEGNVTGCFGVATEITQRIAAADAIMEYEKFFSLSKDMLCIAGVDGFFKKINPAFRTVLGYTDKELLAKSFLEFVHPDDQQKTLKELEKLSQGIPTIRFDNRYQCKNGEYRWFSWTSSPAEYEGAVYAVARDITDRVNTTEELRKNENFLSSLIEYIPHMIFVKEAKHLRFIRFNKAGEELLGLSREEMIGKNDFDLFSKDEADYFSKMDRQVLKGRSLVDIYEEEVQTRNNGIRILHTKKIPLYDHNGNPEYLLGISEDITETKKAQEALKLSEAKLKEAQEIAHVGSWEYDVASKVLEFSDETFRIFGLQPSNRTFSEKEFMSLIHPEDREMVATKVIKAIKDGIRYEIELKHKRPDGTIRILSATGKPVRKKDRTIKLFGTGLDITDQKIAEKKVMKALIEGQDMERKRIAEDLHDSLGQKLSALKLNCNAIEEESKNFSERNLEAYTNLQNILKEVITEVRNISHNLMPEALHNFGLHPALKDLSSKLNHSKGIAVYYEYHGKKTEYDKALEVGVYRIAQELVNNALKHAKAQEISVQIFNRDKKLILTVEDDGIGFDWKNGVFEKGFGFSSINSRVKALNGIFSIESNLGVGTMASVEVPLE